MDKSASGDPTEAVAEAFTAQSFLGDLVAAVRQPPKILYHYTSAEGLLGIVTEGVLRASHADYLNDAGERTYTRDLLRKCIAGIQEQCPIELHQDLQLMSLLTHTSDVRENIYVSCFSSRADVLSQWRGYSSRGSGFAIGLDLSDLESPPFQNGRVTLMQVVYDAEKHEAEITKVLKRAIQVFSELQARFEVEALATAVALRAADDLFELFASFKAPCWEEEAEWRLVAIRTGLLEFHLSELDFRVRGGNILPYLKLPLVDDSATKHQLIRNVVIGPGTVPKLNSWPLRMLLTKHGLPKDLPIVQSSIPLRL
jgi:hypothetical protein